MQKLFIKLNPILKIIIFSPLFIYIGERSLIAYDEGYYVLQSRWILENDNWIGPMWFDKVILDRTIGIQYLLAISQKIFGENNFGIFFPIIFASIIMLYLTYLIHKELFGNEHALISPLVLSTTFLWINYANIASQDIVFAAIITFGIFATLKASKTNRTIFYFLSSIWIGFGFMLKTYLTLIPFISILPILVQKKLIFKKSFWLGLLTGFLPFILWSYNAISFYGLNEYNGLFRKLLILSAENNFSNPFYYYLWNLPANIFPWSVFLFSGFIISYKKKDNLIRYFLFIYPIIYLLCLSIFSTKTQYYPLPILSLTSLNIFLGIKSIQKNNNPVNKIIKFLNFKFLPLIIILLLIIFNSKLINLNLSYQQIIILYFGISSFSTSWFLINFLKHKHRIKLFLIILGPYLLFASIFHSGLITDRSKDLRLASDKLINNNNLSGEYIYAVKSDINNDLAHSKLIKILINMPKHAKGINNLNDLERNKYAWTTTSEEALRKFPNINIIDKSEIFKPWRLVLRK